MIQFFSGMIGYYLTGSFIISLLLFFTKNKLVNYGLTFLFIVLQWVLTVYEYNHLNTTELQYFTPDSLALLCLGILSILCVPAFYHSHIYCNSKDETPRHRGIYFAALVILLASLSAAYLSNHIAITWIFVELTTLSSSALIYHRRNSRTLEGTWKYIFVCSISITFVFIGILFLSVAVQRERIEVL